MAAPGGLRGRELEVLGWTTEDDSGEIALLCRLVDGSAGEIPARWTDLPVRVEPQRSVGGVGSPAAWRLLLARGERLAGRRGGQRWGRGHDWQLVAGVERAGRRVLRATDARYERSPRGSASWRVARRTWRYLRCAGSARLLVEDDGERPQRWLRTYRGDVALEHAP